MKPFLQITLAILVFSSGVLGLEMIQRARHPTVGFRHMTNSQGFRSPEFSTQKSPGVFRIIFIGSSTTYGVGGTVEDTFPYLTGKLLNQGQADVKIESLNAAQPGQNSYWLPIRLEEILPFEPDLVMVMIGENDCVSIHQDFLDITTRGDLKRISWQKSLSSWIASYSVLYVTAREKMSLWLYGSPRFAFDNPVADKRLSKEINPQWFQYYPNYFEQNIEAGIRIAKSQHIPLIFIHPPLSHKRRSELPNYALAYDILMARLKAVTARENIRLIPTDAFYADLEAGFGPEWDGIHLPKAANEKMARLISRYFSENNLLKMIRGNKPG